MAAPKVVIEATQAHVKPTEEADTIPAKTTAEEDRLTKAARAINLIWEITQALIALTVVLANILAVFYGKDAQGLLANAFFLVIGFYFGRTNHARSGGVPDVVRR